MRFTITSRQNPRIVEISKLKQKKFRDETGLVILEGERIVCDALNQGIQPKSIAVCENALAKFEHLLNTVDCDIFVLAQNVFEVLTNTQNSQGILAVVKFEPSPFCLPTQNFLVLDGVQDPGNLGTIIRTAVALNYTQIYLHNCVDIRNDKVLRATMGTVFKAKLMIVDVSLLQQIANQANLVVADMNGTDLHKIALKGMFGIVLGNEAHGVSSELKNLSKKTVSVPMQNNVESLNVAVAGALLMYGLKS